MGELRDTHRMEGTSQGDLISKLCSQLATVEGNLVSQAADLLAAEQLRADLTKAQTQAKEEEEKRTKAISLLKTVRMKLVKAEKDRAEERAERSRAGEETERVKAEREREVNALRKGFEREVAGAKERFEKDLGARKAAWELEMITTKVRLLFRMGVQADVLLSFRLLMRRRCLEESQRSTDWRRS
jgi:small-conductance mechanosensitive channel